MILQEFKFKKLNNKFFTTLNLFNIPPILRLFFCISWFIILGNTGYSQIVNLPCQSEVDAFIGLDRNNWNGGTTDAHSEGVMHNFDLPNNTFGDCKKITNVEINITINSVDDSGLPGDCPLFDYFINFSDNCPDFAPASCDFIFNQIQGFPVSQTVNFTCPPIDFAFGETLGVDIVPAMGNTACSVGQSTISSGSIVLDYELCVTVTVEDLLIDVPADLGMDQTICATETTTLDPGSYTSYDWDPNGETTPTIDVGPGNYTVTVTDMNGCTDTDEINILQYPDSGITFDPASPNVCDNGQVAVTVNENYAMYNWSNAMTGQTVMLSTGNYDVTITDSNNCTAVNSINVSNVDPPNAGIDNFLDVCNDGTAYNLDALLLAHDPGGNWSDDDGVGIDVNINPMATDFTDVTPGTYTFTYTVDGLVPCPADQAVITIQVFEQNFAGVSDNIQFCADPGNLDFVLSLGNPDPGGIWSDLDGSTVDLTDPFAVNFNGIAAGTYNFEYLLTANGPCEEQSEILTVVILESAFAGLDAVTTVCEGAQLDLQTLVNGANGSGVFFDSDGSGALTGSVFNTSGFAGQSFNFTFTVGSMSSPCGQDEAIFTVNIESSLSAGDDALGSFCTDGDIDLFDVLTNEDAGGTFFDVNMSGGLSGSILTTTNITPGVYSYQYIVGDGITCPQDDAEITLTFFEDPSYSFAQSEAVICEDFCEELEINFSGEPPFNFPIEIYSSGSGNLIISIDTTLTSNTLTFTACNSGTIEFANDTLNLPNDSVWYVTIPTINDVNCTIDFLSDSDTLTISTLSNTLFELDTTACITDTLVINGVMLFNGNATFQDTIPGMNCDSIININVNFLDADTVTIDPTICSGDSIMIEGLWFSEAVPNAEINVVNPNGCDSLLVIDVSFFPPADSMLNLTLCTGDSIIVNNTVYNASNTSGTEVLMGQSVNGCDSTIEVSLQFSNDIMIAINDTLCADGFVDIAGQIFDIASPSGQVILNGTGCDTIIDIDLSFHEEVDSTLSGVFCPDFSIDVNGTTYDINNAMGSEILVDSSQFGCDSIVNIDLLFYDIADSLISGTFCPDFSIIVNGTQYDSSNPTGSELISGSSQFGCDSLVNIDLGFFAPVSTDFNQSICENDSIIINGTVYNSSNTTGVEIITDGSVNGCDSTVNVQLSILPIFEETDMATICDGDSIFLAGDWQFTAGSFIDTLQSIDMCDSIITTELMVISCEVNVTLSAVNNECAMDANGSITLDILSDINIPFTIIWDGISNGVTGSLVIDTDQNMITIGNLISDTYNITIQDAAGTSIYQGTVSIIDNNPIMDGDWIITDSILCAGDFGSFEFQANGGMSPYGYNWDPTIIGDSPLAQDVIAGEYFLTVTDQNGCTLDTTFVMPEPDAFSATISVIGPSCLGSIDGQIEISEIIGGISPYNVTVNGEVLIPMVLSDLDTGLYVIEIMDANGCMISFSEELTANNNSIFASYTELHQIDSGESVALEGSVIDSSGMYTYEWIDLDGSLSCIDCPNPISMPAATTTYSLNVFDSLGCSQALSITVEVEPREIVNIHPNVFSPNGDNSNDEFIFRINDTDLVSMAMSIYDRWGNLVFRDQAAENELSWDGTRNGSLLVPGVYVYQMIIQYADGRSEVVIGDVLLIN